MKTPTLASVTVLAVGISLPALSQDPLRLPSQDWLRLEHRHALAPNDWRQAIGFAPTARVQWSLPVGQYRLGMSLATGREYESAPIFGAETKQYGLFGRYSLTQDWSVNAEAFSRDAGTVFRLQDFRIGLQRQF